MVKETRAARRFSSRATKNKAPARHKQGADAAHVGNKQGAGAKTRKGGAAAAPTTTALRVAPPAPSALAAAAAEPAAVPAAPALGTVPPAPSALAAAAAVPAAAPAAPALGIVSGSLSTSGGGGCAGSSTRSTSPRRCALRCDSARRGGGRHVD
jgi:hypothetical protein